LIGLAPFLIAPALAAAAAVLVTPADVLGAPVAALTRLNIGVLGLCVVAGVGLGARLARGPRGAAATWDCGYAAPGPRMQYSASSFGDLLVRAFAFALWPLVRAPRLETVFPARGSFHSDVPDVVLDRIVSPLSRALARILNRSRALQQGSIHAYLLYVWLTLVALLVVTGLSG
jgi:hydrogenase-4 component B